MILAFGTSCNSDGDFFGSIGKRSTDNDSKHSQSGEVFDASDGTATMNSNQADKSPQISSGQLNPKDITEIPDTGKKLVQSAPSETKTNDMSSPAIVAASPAPDAPTGDTTSSDNVQNIPVSPSGGEPGLGVSLVIDDFSVPRPFEFIIARGERAYETESSGIIGHERELGLQTVGPGSAVVEIGDHFLNVGDDASSGSVVTLTYAGIGQSGLGGIDLTNNERNLGIAFYVDSDAAPRNFLYFDVTIQVIDDDTGVVASYTRRYGPGAWISGQYVMEFAMFEHREALAHADRIVITLNNSAGVDYIISYFNVVTAHQ